MAKILWTSKKVTDDPWSANTPNTMIDSLKAVEFIEKDVERFPDTHGWGYGTFEYDAVAHTFSPASEASKPPQGHDAKCGAACHNLAASKDYIFTPYAQR